MYVEIASGVRPGTQAGAPSAPLLRPVRSRPGGDLGARAEAELGEDVGDVDRHRPLAEEHRRRDLAIGAPVGDQQATSRSRSVKPPKRSLARARASVRGLDCGSPLHGARQKRLTDFGVLDALGHGFDGRSG